MDLLTYYTKPKMKHLLKSDIQAIAEKIVNSEGLENVVELQQLAKELYEKLTILKFMESGFNSTPQVTNETSVVTKEEPASIEEMPVVVVEESVEEEDLGDNELMSTLDENLFVSEEHIDENLIEPATEKIKDIVAQMPPETQQVDELIETVVATTTVQKNDPADIAPTQEDIIQVAPVTTTNGDGKKSLNDKLKKGITIGLNDRIAFVKHLFDGSTEDFNRVISQLNTLGSELEALEFLNNMVKPEYSNWSGKEEYEQRFLSFIEGKY